MSKRDKLIKKIHDGKNVSYQDAENLLLGFGFQLKINGSHTTLENRGIIEPLLLKKENCFMIIKSMI